MEEITEESSEQPRIEKKLSVKKLYFEFLDDFKDYLVEYVREAAIDLTMSSFEVSTVPQKLFYGENGGIQVTLKNQGENPCYLTTDRTGAFKLDPNEKEKFWLNKEVVVVTLSGVTTVGFIRS